MDDSFYLYNCIFLLHGVTVAVASIDCEMGGTVFSAVSSELINP